MTEMLDVAQIKGLIPHRYPVLLVDAVVELVPGERVVAVKAVTVNEPWYRRLPPDAPPEAYAYPVALMVEAWCQTAAVLAAATRRAAGGAIGKDEIAIFGGASGIQISGPVYPGAVIRQHATLAKAVDDVWIFEGHAEVDGAPVLTVESLTTALRPVAALRPPTPAQVPA